LFAASSYRTHGDAQPDHTLSCYVAAAICAQSPACAVNDFKSGAAKPGLKRSTLSNQSSGMLATRV
jgi:hypothetical protein